MVAEIRERMDSDDLEFVALAGDNQEFKLQVKKALDVRTRDKLSRSD